jgi:hypothetical protein
MWNDALKKAVGAFNMQNQILLFCNPTLSLCV